MSVISDQFPYPSQRMPAMGRNMVATSQPLAVQAGQEHRLVGRQAFDGEDAPGLDGMAGGADPVHEFRTEIGLDQIDPVKNQPVFGFESVLVQA